jgi:hypothetical protein
VQSVSAAQLFWQPLAAEHVKAPQLSVVAFAQVPFPSHDAVCVKVPTLQEAAAQT